MSLDGKRILLAGASGMVGTAVLRALLEYSGDCAVRAVRFRGLPTSTEEGRVEWVSADLRLQEDCRRVASGCQCCVMAAATTAGSLGMAEEPWRPMGDNVILNTQLFEALHFCGVERVVFISSATVYQEFQGAIREEEIDLNQEPHPAHFGVGWAMRFCEKLCRFWHEKTSMNVTAVRAANVYGPYAAFDPKRSNVIPALIRKAVDRMDPFEVWGSPNVVRDVVFTADFAEAVVRLLDYKGEAFEAFNIGSGKGTTVRDMVRHTLDAARHNPSVIGYGKGAPEVARVRVLDCSKIRDRIGWEPRQTVEEGIRETTRWWVENKDEWKK